MTHFGGSFVLLALPQPVFSMHDEGLSFFKTIIDTEGG